MASTPLGPDESRRLLELVRSDRDAAAREVASLSHAVQVALVCDAPLAQRAALLGVLPQPEAVIPELPEAELCFTVNAIGLADAGWLLECATPEQVVAGVDLDAWNGYELDLSTLSDWVGALADASQSALLRSARALDPELLVLLLKSRLFVEQKPASDEDWQPPEGTQTLEGQFYFRALGDKDDLADIVVLLRTLFEEEYWTYFRLMQGVVWELESDTTEWALRWRSGRLEDLGFPPWDEAMPIYRFLSPEERVALPEKDREFAVESWALPVWLPQLPDAPDARRRVFRAIAELDPEERRSCFYEFVAMANKIAVADQLPLSDAESTPQAIEKAARFMSDGIEHVAREHGLSDPAVLRRVSLERLFTIGANLDPLAARP
jgi:hypothetical protein